MDTCQAKKNIEGVMHFKSALNVFFGAFPEFRVEILTQIAEGDVVATRKMFRGTHLGKFMGVSATGKPVEFNVM